MEIIQGSSYVEPGCNSDGGEGITISGTVDPNVPGTYTITYTSTDKAGNVGTEIRDVIVIADNSAPVLTLTGPSPMEVSQGGSYVEPGCSGDGGEFECTVTGTVNTDVPGTYILTYTSVDQAGNVGTITREVIVKDSTAPVMTLNGESPMQISQGGSYNELGAFTDGGEEVAITGTVDTDVPGTYTITYTATDQAGNVSTATRDVIVIADNAAPVVTLNGASHMEISQGGSYNELGAFTDGGEEVTITGTVDPDVPGTYTITYTATDAAGNVGTRTREVIVKDNTAPVVTLNGASHMQYTQGASYRELGAFTDGGEEVSITGTVGS
eukprot:UN01345